MTPVIPVVPMLRAPDCDDSGGADHQVRVDGRAVCRAKVDPDTWRVIPAHKARHRCAACDQETT